MAKSINDSVWSESAMCSSFSSITLLNEGESSSCHLALLQKFIDSPEADTVKVEDVLENSKKFPVQFPVHTPRLENNLISNPFKNELRKQGKIFNKDTAEKMVNSAYPIIHERALSLFTAFVLHKVEHGETIEKEFYKDMTVYDLVDKLISNRPVVYKNSWDQFLLLDGTPGFGGFEGIGKEINPKPEMNLERLNSYDEMRLSALITMSSMSLFINDGGKNNCGVVGNGVTHELDGAILGQVGARFEKEGYMDWIDCIVSKYQNTRENGYGKDNTSSKGRLLQSWANTWGLECLPTLDEVKENPHNYEYINIKDAYLNKKAYKARIQMIVEIFLMEASCRSKAVNRKAYIHASGLGLNNSWMISPIQTRLYIEAWAEAIQHMALNVTDNIACINFSCIAATRIQGVKSGDKFPNTDITIRFTKRDMLERVPRGCLLVCNYPADSNACPGNEFWSGSLASSTVTAAACSSSVAELHNPNINPRMSSRYLRVASRTEGVVPVSDYLQSLK